MDWVAQLHLPSPNLSRYLLTEQIVKDNYPPKTDNTYESSILAASPSVQSVSFPEPQDISFDTSILRPTTFAYTSQEPSRLSTIYKSPLSESPSIITSSSSPSLMPTALVSVSSLPSLPPMDLSSLLQVPPSTTVVTPSLFFQTNFSRFN